MPAPKTTPDLSPVFATTCNQWASQVIQGLTRPTPVQILALRSAVAAVARRARAEDISYDQDGFAQNR